MRCLSLRAAAWGVNTCGMSSLGKTKANPTMLSRCGDSGAERGPALSNAHQDQSRPPEGLSDEISSYSEQGGKRANKAGEAQFSTDHRGTKADNQQKQSMEDRELL